MTHDSCPRCGLTVDVTSERLRELLDAHVARCMNSPSASEVRALRRKVASERFLYGEQRARQLLERELPKVLP
ncbi:MAG TPA: hypothetical protein VFF67_10370 [Thermoplasmata archaeon]|nr:hypothetical protein [Thermoplasmata archaeon]